jgi:uncharacterized membrane protein YheB (UPF0754 family)
MKTILIFLAPPLAGAIIGYVTNALAIKMLFRPLKEIRLWGLRIPFTPGILPRQRHKLAESIGRMVERELLTAEIVRARLARPDVREGVRKPIESFTQKILDTPLEEIVKNSAVNGADASQVIRELFEYLLKSPAMESLFSSFITAFSEYTKRDASHKRTLRDFLGKELTEKVECRIAEIIKLAVASRPGPLLDMLVTAGEKIYPRLRTLVVQFLNKEEIRRSLEYHGRIFLSNVILKMNIFQRFFISAGQYDITLQNRMGEIISDLIEQIERLLAEKESQVKFIGLFRDSAESFLSSPEALTRLSQFAAHLVISPSDHVSGKMFTWNADLLQEAGKKIIDLLKIYVSKSPVPDTPEPAVYLPLEAGETPHAGGEAAAILPGAPQETASDTPDPAVKESGFLPLFLKVFLEQQGSRTIAQLLAIEDEQKARIDALLCGGILKIADEQIEGVLSTINIRALVSERVDSLDMIRVERIILDVMANQLKWINLFGAVLGALIGLFQALFSSLLR